MSGSNYPSGFNSGVTILELPHQPLVNPDSKVLWVDANAGTKSDGSYHKPYATVANAITNAVTGDTIMIAAGHTENLGAKATLATNSVIRITSDGNDTGVTFTITGTNSAGQAVTDVITGPTGTTADGTTKFKYVTSVAISGAGTGNIIVGNVADPNGICTTVTPAGAINMVMDGALVTADDAFSVSTAGLTFIGMGENQRIPTFSTTAQIGAVMITAANTTLQNLKFACNITDCIQAIDLSAAADGTRISNCVFVDGSANLDFLKHIDIATTVTDVIIEGCTFIGIAGSAMTSSIFFTGTSSDVVIRDNFFYTDCSASIIDHLTDIPTNILIHDNRMVNLDATTVLGLGLKSDGAGTGHVFDNYIWCSEAASAIMAVTNDFFVCENYVANDINTSGVLNPAADTI